MVRYNNPSSSHGRTTFTTFQEDIHNLYGKKTNNLRTKAETPPTTPPKVFPSFVPSLLKPPQIHNIFKTQKWDSEAGKDLDEIVRSSFGDEI
jgi:hypothetical protein